VLALTLAFAPAASAQMSPRIVHGADANITDFPYQVALFDPSGPPEDTQFCGGVVLSATQVLTAAHCVVDFGSANLGSPSGIAVFAGANNLADTGPDAVLDQAQTLSIDSAYDPSTNDHDIAIVQLATPLFDTPTSTIAPIPLINDPDLDPLLTAHATATVSGWGCTDPVAAGSSGCPSVPPNILQAVDVPLVAQSDCVSDYSVDSTPITDNMFCAGAADMGADTNTDSCFGDSGGPLTVPNPDTESPDPKVLAGLVDAGNGCAQDGFPGIYTRVSKLTAFIDATDPSVTTAPSVTGAAEVGQTVTCDPGTWTGSPTFDYRFMRDRGGSISTLTGLGPTNTFTITAAAGGTNIFCEVAATGTDAIRSVDSPEVSVPAAPVITPPVTPPPVTPPGVVDSVAPKLRVSKKTCTKISCTLKVTVTDASPSSGIAKVKATLNYTRKVSCRKHGKRTTCTKHLHRALSAGGGSGGKFTIVAKRLTPGTGYTITLVPFDKAGNRPQFSTITSIRTKPRHQSLLG
jgi:secreted trypsin-like serine protease